MTFTIWPYAIIEVEVGTPDCSVRTSTDSITGVIVPDGIDLLHSGEVTRSGRSISPFGNAIFNTVCV